MQFSASQIAQIINGKVEGDANIAVASFGKIEEANNGQLTFFANAKYEDFLYSTNAYIVIISEAYELKKPIKATLIRVSDAYTAFATLLTKYQEIAQQMLTGIQEPSYIAKTASYGENGFIGAFAYRGEKVKVGKNTKIYPNAYVGDKVSIGEKSIIHTGVKIYQDVVSGNNVISNLF